MQGSGYRLWGSGFGVSALGFKRRGEGRRSVLGFAGVDKFRLSEFGAERVQGCRVMGLRACCRASRLGVVGAEQICLGINEDGCCSRKDLTIAMHDESRYPKAPS